MLRSAYVAFLVLIDLITLAMFVVKCKFCSSLYLRLFIQPFKVLIAS
jgi:hypothetical protein